MKIYLESIFVILQKASVEIKCPVILDLNVFFETE